MDRESMVSLVNTDVPTLKSYLKKHPGTLRVYDEKGDSLLHIALAERKEDAALLLIERGCNVKSVNEFGTTALHSAAYWGMPKATWWLLQKGANPNIQGRGGTTPLLFLVEMDGRDDPNYVDSAALLLCHGADPKLANNDGKTPLHVTVNLTIAMLLVAYGADINAVDKGGSTPRQRQSELCGEGHHAVAKYLESIGAQ